MDQLAAHASPASPADIPSLDRVLNQSALQPLLAEHGRTQVTSLLREHLQELRQAALSGTLQRAELDEHAVAAEITRKASVASRQRLRAVFNLTGTVLHTNLGRAVLPDEALRAVARVLSNPVDLEFDLALGRRGDRDSIIEPLLCELTGAEAATVVNNNAAAVLLMLSALAHRREVVVSRGELIEIGGSFRVPDIMRVAGVKLVEVGTTNRTHVSDYADAITPRTAMLMKAHASNYAITGFTSSVPLSALAELGRARGVAVAVDLGSGSLVDLTNWGLPKEATVRETLAAGADLVSFSGDKLLGGPQAGLLVGRAALIGRLRKHPLKRALRVGKLTLAALEAVLGLYRAPEFLAERLTTLRLLTRPTKSIESQAARLQPPVDRALRGRYTVTAEPMLSQIGSGALPVDQLPSHGLVIRPVRERRTGLDALEALLRTAPRPIIGRTAHKALWLDLRCLEESDEPELLAQLASRSAAA